MIKNIKILVTLTASLLIITSCKNSYTYVVNTNNSSLKLDSTKVSDTNYSSVITPYKNQVDKKMNVVLGYAEEEMLPYGSRIELPLGNFAADVQKVQTEKYLKRSVDFSIMNFGGLRAPVNKGVFTVRNAFELMPFDNDLIVLELDGAITKQLFEHIGRGKRIAISNAQLTYKDDKLVSAKINGKDFDPNKTYSLAISDYLANGGDGMDFLIPITKRFTTGKKLRDVMMDYVKDLQAQGKKINSKVEGRIVFQ